MNRQGCNHPSARRLLALAFLLLTVGASTVAAQEIKALSLYEQCAALADGNETVTRALTALKDAKSENRVKAVETLAQSCDGRAVEPLIVLLKDANTTVRIAAVAALGRLGHADAIDPLIELFEDADYKVRAAAAHSLASFSVHRARNAVLNILVNTGGNALTNEGDMRARCLGVLFVNQMRDVRFSRKSLNFLFEFLDNPNPKLREIAEQTALELKNTRNGYHELIGILKQATYPDSRRKAAYWLGKLGIQEASSALAVASVGDSDPAVQKTATEALAALKKQ